LKARLDAYRKKNTVAIGSVANTTAQQGDAWFADNFRQVTKVVNQPTGFLKGMANMRWLAALKTKMANGYSWDTIPLYCLLY
jgi:hypothetical protein